MKYAFWMGVLMIGLASSGAAGTVPEDRVVKLHVADDPTVSISLWFKVGSQNDPPGKEGLAAVTAAMLAEASTQKAGYEQILDALYPLAGSYDASVSVEMTVVSGRIHKDNLRAYYPLLIDAVSAPAFRQDDLDRLKSRTLNYLENTLRYASDEELGKAVLHTTVFAGTPYGHLPAGTVAAVRSITLDDVRKFYAAHYTRDNVVIGVGGGFEPALIEQLRFDLGRLPAGAPRESLPSPSPKPIRGLQVTIVEKDAPATAISIGRPLSILRGPRAWYALATANSWFGEHRNQSSHLYNVIREQRGLNYGDYSYLEHFADGGELQLPPTNIGRRCQLFEIWIRPVPNETGHFALRAALRELKRLVDRGLTQEEFDLTRKFLRNYVLHYAVTTEDRLGYAIDDRFYGLEESHLTRFRRLMDQIDRDETNAAVKKYLQYDDLQIVVVTKDAAAFRDALIADRPSPIQYPTPKPQTVLDEDREISVFPLKIRPENIRIVPVSEVFAK